jgi:cyclopropane-fatty-acyl-phospholipid synthase
MNATGTAPESPPTAESTHVVEQRLLRELLRRLNDPAIVLVLWDGTEVYTSTATPVARIHIRDRGTLYRLVLDGELGFGDAYTAGRVRVEGDLEKMIEEIYVRGAGRQVADAGAPRFAQWLYRASANTLAGSRENIHRHYDIGNEFYSLWLGRTMAYTCAYFPNDTATLDEAQVAKMDHVCRKLQLEPGETVVEAGCGWGALALHMAQHYGVRVQAYNISHEQIAFARERATAAGLNDRVEYIEDDYRNIRGQYDAFVSIGMLEHVGVDNYPELGRVVAAALQPLGRGLIHTIGRNQPKPMHRWIEKRIFPGAYPPTLGEMSNIFAPSDLSVLDVENLRLHYARTLECWSALFERSRDRIAAMFDENFVRMWRLYLAGSVAAFRVGELQLFQVLFAPRGNNAVPWTREHLYRDPPRMR